MCLWSLKIHSNTRREEGGGNRTRTAAARCCTAAAAGWWCDVEDAVIEMEWDETLLVHVCDSSGDYRDLTVSERARWGVLVMVSLPVCVCCTVRFHFYRPMCLQRRILLTLMVPVAERQRRRLQLQTNNATHSHTTIEQNAKRKLRRAPANAEPAPTFCTLPICTWDCVCVCRPGCVHKWALQQKRHQLHHQQRSALE